MCSKAGMATVRSSITIELLIYGVTPMANRDAWAKAPPERVSR
jgi:hypothetical protein